MPTSVKINEVFDRAPIAQSRCSYRFQQYLTVVILSCFKHADSQSVKYSPRIREEHQKPPFCLLSRLA